MDLGQVLYENDLIKEDHDNFSGILINRKRLLARMLLQHYGPDVVLQHRGKTMASPLAIMIAGDTELVEHVNQLAGATMKEVSDCYWPLF